MRLHRKTASIVVAGAVTLTVGGVLGGTAYAHGTPRSDKQIPNLTDVQNKITAYHDSGAWNRQEWRVDNRARHYIAHRLARGVHNPAITLDVDDTVLSTYAYEQTNGYGYVPSTSLAWEMAKKQTAIPATRSVVRYAHAHGVKVIYITGRRQDPKLKKATVQNLVEQGYPKPDGMYLRPTDDKNASAIPYKSGIRAQLERQGYDIVANFGDQWSDLRGGHADYSVKIPNPMYSIP